MDADCTRAPAPGAALALGTWALAGDAAFGYGPCAPDVARATLEAALEAGCRRFDTAAAFADGAVERLLGEVIAGRADVAVTTRVGFAWANGRAVPDFAPDRLEAQVAASARRLKGAPPDRVLLFTPSPATLRDGRALRALLLLKRRGLAREVGVSVNEPAEGRMALDAGVDWVCVPYNLLNRKCERALLPHASGRGARVLAREPLHNGLLTDRPGEPAAWTARDLRRAWPPAFLEAAGRARARMAECLPGRGVTALALGYVLGQPLVAEVAVGCRGEAQVRRAFAARPLDPEARARLERALYEAPPRRTAASMASISSSDSP